MQKLTIFISSHIREFPNTRRRIYSELRRTDFFEPVLLEKSGARPESVEDASIRRAREADVYVGIFGEKFSPTTIAEFREAWKSNKPCFVYLFNGGDGDDQLQEFIAKEIQPVLKYAKEENRSQLISRIREDLILFAGEVLSEGVRAWVEKQRNEKLPPLKRLPAASSRFGSSDREIALRSTYPLSRQILLALLENPLTIQDLSRSLGRSRPTVVHELQSLLKRGLVLRTIRLEEPNQYELTTLGFAHLEETS